MNADVPDGDPPVKVSGSAADAAAGWRELNKPWHNTAVDYCDVCGNLLIRRYWGFVGADGETLRACREDDVRLYAVLRRHRGAVGFGTA